MNEVTIDLFDLFKKILSKWKTVICLGVCFAVLGGWYGYDSAVKHTEASEEQHRKYLEDASGMPDYFTEELYNLRSSLSENAADFAEAYAKIYGNFLEKYCDEAYDAENDKDLEAYMMFLDSYKDVLSVMGGTQREYYDMLISADKTGNARAQETQTSSQEVSVFQLKWIIIGFLGGIVIACICIAVPYLTSQKLRTAKDMDISFGVPLLAVAEEISEAQTDVLATGICAVARKKGLHSIALWGSGDKDAAKIRDALAGQFQKEGFQAVSSNELDEQEFLKKLAEAESAVLIERKGKSRYKEIRNETDVCRNFGVDLIGSIVVK